MRALPIIPCFTAVLLSLCLVLTGCQCPHHKGSMGKKPEAGSAGHVRTPAGSATCHAAAVAFFNAYKTHNRAAASQVAADAALNKLNWNASAGTNPTLQLVDDTHIYYEGGGINLKTATNADGRCYIAAVTLIAD